MRGLVVHCGSWDRGRDRDDVGSRTLWGGGQCVKIRIRRLWDYGSCEDAGSVRQYGLLSGESLDVNVFVATMERYRTWRRMRTGILC
ncbi:hypothetical protein HBH56_149810 [Parastagonospora nodorum]|uniref:Uncharacterized protein n=1 Tax=Phaeosphaeria nodorum (strain SN15 / ATCC MYA-4574 / FGSC 10173) TaxID=321614 RepID=A0A7U2HZC6_PHANO|nr:hypothetical protein HBH56_149810 [Parastagonospora nodorum]QRC94216.1 hypothetical protein JI435_405380 [Parastagonospora nodorum SN15]KAH3928322.1 hypothetical protein HBH54_135710 [Parastagonospora nodorum]KAH4142416.1 hypothetical protein HBH45_054540 [Parastagonospora nodorum]KAH4156110.1 hypothetical protein HBH44_131280 [Parastagonospora nodorum]